MYPWGVDGFLLTCSVSLFSLHIILSGSPGHSAYLQSQPGGKCEKLQHVKAYLCLEMCTGTSITAPDITSMLMWFQWSSMKLQWHKTGVTICGLEITVGKKTSLVKCWLFLLIFFFFFFFRGRKSSEELQFLKVPKYFISVFVCLFCFFFLNKM